jgi:hypothetical protein
LAVISGCAAPQENDEYNSSDLWQGADPFIHLSLERMIPENPFFVLLLGGGFGIVCLALWSMSRHWLPLALAGGAILITAILVSLSFFIQSPREQVEWTVHQLAMACEQNDASKLLEFVSADMTQVRADAQREMDRTKFIHCWIPKIHSIKFDEADPNRAQVHLAVIADVEESAYGAGRGRVQLWLDLEKESDGRWRVTAYRYTVE